MEFNLVTLQEYSKIHNIATDRLRWKCNRGSFLTAQKIGVQWFIDKNEPFIDWKKTDIKMIVGVLKRLKYDIKKEKGIYYVYLKTDWIEIPNNMNLLKVLLNEGNIQSSN